MTTRAIHRRRVEVLIVAVCLTFSLQHVTATAVDGRTDDKAKPVIFIHGFSGANCEGDWGFLLDHLRASGWTGEFRVLKFLSGDTNRSEEHTSELQSQSNLVCRLL